MTESRGRGGLPERWLAAGTLLLGCSFTMLPQRRGMAGRRQRQGLLLQAPAAGREGQQGDALRNSQRDRLARTGNNVSSVCFGCHAQGQAHLRMVALTACPLRQLHKSSVSGNLLNAGCCDLKRRGQARTGMPGGSGTSCTGSAAGRVTHSTSSRQEPSGGPVLCFSASVWLCCTCSSSMHSLAPGAASCQTPMRPVMMAHAQAASKSCEPQMCCDREAQGNLLLQQAEVAHAPGSLIDGILRGARLASGQPAVQLHHGPTAPPHHSLRTACHESGRSGIASRIASAG